jgi:hypothetical protein
MLPFKRKINTCRKVMVVCSKKYLDELSTLCDKMESSCVNKGT